MHPMSSVDIGGYQIQCVQRGDGPSVVFVHGSAGDHRTWHRQIGEFSTHYRAIAYSRRYHWPNQPIPDQADYAMDEHVDDLRALIASLNIAPAHLVGHSYGAFVCLLLAMQEPGLVRSLTLAEPPVVTLFVSNAPRPSEIFRLILARPRTAAAIMKFGARGIQPATAAFRRGDVEHGLRIFGRAVLGRDAFDKLSEARMQQVRDNYIAAEFLGSGFPRLDADRVRLIACPTLLMHGERSPALFLRLIDRLHELLPRSKRVEIARASHIVHEDNPEDFDAAVLAFLADQPR